MKSVKKKDKVKVGDISDHEYLSFVKSQPDHIQRGCISIEAWKHMKDLTNNNRMGSL